MKELVDVLSDEAKKWYIEHTDYIECDLCNSTGWLGEGSGKSPKYQCAVCDGEGIYISIGTSGDITIHAGRAAASGGRGFNLEIDENGTIKKI